MLLLIWLHSWCQCAQMKMKADTLHIQDEEPSVPCIVYAGGCWRVWTKAPCLDQPDGDAGLGQELFPAWPGAPMHCWLTPAPPVAKLPEKQAMVTGKAEDLQNPAFLSWCSLPCKCRKKKQAPEKQFFWRREWFKSCKTYLQTFKDDVKQKCMGWIFLN